MGPGMKKAAAAAAAEPARPVGRTSVTAARTWASAGAALAISKRSDSSKQSWASTSRSTRACSCGVIHSFAPSAGAKTAGAMATLRMAPRASASVRSRAPARTMSVRASRPS